MPDFQTLIYARAGEHFMKIAHNLPEVPGPQTKAASPKG
jgi:hypothetical protein